jgi:hypothetical protein
MVPFVIVAHVSAEIAQATIYVACPDLANIVGSPKNIINTVTLRHTRTALPPAPQIRDYSIY